ncbi:hypothetical protein A2258_01250 [Candidatus Uhrbacteria bacterium RIFOXYA2_FULL_41_8]|nr:MAG: hypothetical protein A2258_01250 [Candidatus Uhrbacteria bacterium RIFOXYA2_FULL_41_8]
MDIIQNYGKIIDVIINNIFMSERFVPEEARRRPTGKGELPPIDERFRPSEEDFAYEKRLMEQLLQDRPGTYEQKVAILKAIVGGQRRRQGDIYESYTQEDAKNLLKLIGETVE